MSNCVTSGCFSIFNAIFRGSFRREPNSSGPEHPSVEGTPSNSSSHESRLTHRRFKSDQNLNSHARRVHNRSRSMDAGTVSNLESEISPDLSELLKLLPSTDGLPSLDDRTPPPESDYQKHQRYFEEMKPLEGDAGKFDHLKLLHACPLQEQRMIINFVERFSPDKEHLKKGELESLITSCINTPVILYYFWVRSDQKYINYLCSQSASLKNIVDNVYTDDVKGEIYARSTQEPGSSKPEHAANLYNLGISSGGHHSISSFDEPPIKPHDAENSGAPSSSSSFVEQQNSSRKSNIDKGNSF